jgi:glycosyltransferase involved in cell wall biosynthesis
MRVAIIHYAAPPVVGGVETVIARQAELIRQGGHEVVVLAGRGSTWDERIPVIVYPRFDSRHPEVLELKACLDRGEVPSDFEQVVEAAQADLEEGLAGVDVVIAHNIASLHMNLALTAALQRYSQKASAARVILWHHDLAWSTPRYQQELHAGWPWDILRQAWPGVTQVVVSQARLEELSALTGLAEEEIRVIPAGVDLVDFFRLTLGAWNLYQKLQLATAQPLLLTPVRLTPRKNLEQSLQILAELRKRLPQAQLVITGPPGAHNPANDTYFRALKNLRQSLKLQGAAHLLAEFRPEGLTSAEVIDFYHLADVLLLTSREEGFGIPILEAGLGRLPIFCTNLDPLQDLAGPYATYFSPDDLPGKIAESISARLETEPVYQLRRRVRGEYTWQAIYASQIAPLLEE